jgi:hypothetical protein
MKFPGFDPVPFITERSGLHEAVSLMGTEVHRVRACLRRFQ